MKKISTLVMCLFVAVAASAQTAVEGNKFADNWSFGINVGGTSPLTHSAFFKNMRPVVGVDLTKQFTPVFGLGIEAMGAINTTGSKNAFDQSNISLLGNWNLSNLFGRYNGTPRTFELEAVTGIGWGHDYFIGKNADDNTMTSKLGLNFNFNLGESKAWTLGIKPALVYDMINYDKNGAAHVQYNANQAAWEITLGLKYHFRCSNGEHHFTPVRPYNQGEIDALNDQINSLRRDAQAKDDALKAANQKADDLQKALDECNNKKPQVVKETVTNDKKTLESVVTFRQGKTTIDNSQLPNVERIATYLKNHKDASVVIKGYASPEGSAEVNERIAKQRAEAVKTMLTSKYKIAAKRISAEGQGVGNMFEEADWNRVSICTIAED